MTFLRGECEQAGIAGRNSRVSLGVPPPAVVVVVVVVFTGPFWLGTLLVGVVETARFIGKCGVAVARHAALGVVRVVICVVHTVA